KPAKQQIVAHLLAQLPLASDRIQRDEQQRFQYPLGSYRRASNLRIHPVKHPRQSVKFLIRHLLDPSERMVTGDASLNRYHGQQARLFILKPTHQRLRALIAGILTYTVVFGVEKISKPGVFQHPAKLSNAGLRSSRRLISADKGNNPSEGATV